MALAMLTACSEPDIILPGDRFDIRPNSDGANQSRAISLPSMRANANWSERSGNAQNRIVHPALGTSLSPIFAVNIGEGDSRSARITADPVVVGGVIYTLDARSRVTATATSGAPVWATDVARVSDNRNDASGGGVAVSGGRVFVTTGFGELTALDAASGATLWTQDLDAPGTAAPTVLGNLVYVVSRDSTAWAIEVDTGRIAWQLDGTPSQTAFGGGAGAAVTNDIAILPFPSGEVVATFPKGGARRWSSVVSGERVGQVVARISDIAGDPVIDGNTTYVGNFSGGLVSLDTFSGDRNWTAGEGAVNPVWPTGNSVFIVNDLNQLVRLDKADGSVIWRVDLPKFVDTGTIRKRRTVFAHYGPILAGGRLIVASSDGQLRSFSPTSGALLSATPIPNGAATNPVVAGNTLYVVTKAGQLVAFR